MHYVHAGFFIEYQSFLFVDNNTVMYTDFFYRRYQAGQVITASVRMTIGHTGYFEFRLCPWNDPNTPVTEECLNR